MSLKLLRACALLAACGSASAYADQPPPGQVHIRSIQYAGTGCDLGTVAENLSSDLKAFTLVFTDYVAEIGPGVSRTMNRRFCNVIVDLQVPSGWSYTVFNVDYRGYTSLDRGVEGMQQSRYYFQGRVTGSKTLASVFRGPIDKDYVFRDTLGLEASEWSPCGASRALILDTEIRLNNRQNSRGTGIITTDSINGELIHQYGIAWRRCSMR